MTSKSHLEAEGVPTANPAVEDGAKAILRGLETEFAQCRAEIDQRLQAARTSSETEVMAIGEAINLIVERAKAYVERIDEQLRLQAAGEQQTSAMVKEMVASVHAQEETVERAMAQSSAILRAGRDVQAMASATRLLSLNARVEASRLGDQGSSFSVIADEMRQLSHAVQQTNSSVASMAKELERLLPMISQQTRAFQAQFEEFNRHVELQLHTLRADERDSGQDSPVVEQIMDAAYEALSHLAFQDPMIQSLDRIQTSLDRVQRHFDRCGQGEIAADPMPPPAEAAEAEANDCEAGEVLLF